MSIIVAIIIILTVPAVSLALEEAAHKVVEREGPFEIRDYAPQLLAVVEVDGE